MADRTAPRRRARAELQHLTGDLVFAEGPRWHEGRLWFSDMHGEAVYSVSLDGDRRQELALPGRRPSGLGFLPDGSLLVVSMLERQVLRWDGASLAVHGDLSGLETDGCNDMLVTAQGVAYVDAFPTPVTKPASIYRVDPDGTVGVAATDVIFPNGMVLTPSGSLIVAESMGRRFSEYDIGADGSLVNPASSPNAPASAPTASVSTPTVRSGRRCRSLGSSSESLPAARCGKRFPWATDWPSPAHSAVRNAGISSC